MAKTVPIKKRRARQREEIIDACLQVAREMMQAEGVGALSFNGIARAMGIKPPSLYTYFDSKHAIYDTLFRRGYEAFGALLDDLDTTAPPRTTLRALIRGYMSFAHDNPDLFQLMFQRPVPGFVPSDESLQVSFGVLEKGRRITASIIEAGPLEPAVTLEEASDLVISLMHGLTALHMANHPDVPVGEGRFGAIIDHAVDMVLAAWGTNNTSASQKGKN